MPIEYDTEDYNSLDNITDKGKWHFVFIVNENTKFLLCGWTAMIDQTIENLILKLGYDKSQVLYELYG